MSACRFEIGICRQSLDGAEYAPEPLYFEALEFIEALEPVVFDEESKFRCECFPDLGVDGGFPIVAQAGIGPEQAVYKEGTNMPRATWPFPSYAPDESGSYQRRDTFWLSWVAEEPAEVGVGFWVGKEGENLDQGGEGLGLCFM
jgi:hypothetical protein